MIILELATVCQYYFMSYYREKNVDLNENTILLAWEILEAFYVAK